MQTEAVDIVNKAIALGYDTCGIIPVEQMAGYEARLEERMEHFPQTREKYEGFRRFAHPQTEYPWAKAVVIVSFWYGKYRIPGGMQGRVAKYYLTDARKNPDSEGSKTSVALEKYLTDCGFRVATKRNYGTTALRWAAMQAGICRRNRSEKSWECGYTAVTPVKMPAPTTKAHGKARKIFPDWRHGSAGFPMKRSFLQITNGCGPSCGRSSGTSPKERNGVIKQTR